ncbi:acyltransferase family protein [Bifidobacterium longum]|uniref:acyltransferase family protein n=1 Tax=Bifidobacterium longum TaxID=216816 RepID=UPI002073951D|nr:acyltransferase family protein [Bifidobacterium longum]MDW3163528.1 acyltransferase family protein [Bifidobacterium longum]
MKRFVGLNGIKGLALIAIVLYHCMQQRLPGGFYGVDVFFTVSGFLIAVSLIRSLAKTGSLNLVRYIPKRAVRLYPALFLLIPVIVSVGWLFDHDVLVSIRDQVITVLLGCYNWYAIAGGQSYFDQMNPQVFRHLWFIGVLMQFYVIVPFIVWLMWKLRQTKLPSLIPLGLAAFSSIAMWVMYVPKGDPTRVYFGTDTHSMGLMLGVALAWWVTAPQLGHARQRAVPMPRTISSSASAAAHRALLPRIPVEHRIWNAAAPVLAFLSLIALVTMAVIGKQDAFAFRGGIILSSLLSVLLIAGTISDDSWMQSLMVFKPLASLGKYSYGIYLWHWPLWILSSALAPKIFKAVGPWPLIMTALLTAIAVMISWLMVEKPAATHSVISVVVPLRTNKKNHAARVIAVDVILVLSLVGCAQGIAHAPAKTAMQIQLEQQAAQLERMQKTEHVLLRHAMPAPPKPKHEMPTGDQITAIGDSVMLASSQGLSEVFPGIQTDASVSRSIMVAPELIGNDLSAGSLRQWVLIGLGTNSAITPDQLDQIRNMIGPDRVLVLVNAHGDRTWIPPTNQVLADYAAAHPDNVVLVDWDATANANAQVLGSDGIHPSMDSDIYAKAVKQATEQWIASGR